MGVMREHATKLIFRLLWVPISAVFLLSLLTTVLRWIGDIYYFYAEDPIPYSPGFTTVRLVIFLIIASWVLSHLGFETAALFKKSIEGSACLQHLRYGPIATFVFSTVILIFFDIAMIEVSRYRINNYLHDRSNVISKPEMALHSDYRSFCGNGYSARDNYLYFDAAASGRDNEDPYVRARTLLMSARVQNWLNGGDPRFEEILRRSCNDPDAVVRETAESYLAGSERNCQSLR